ncbi:MAG: invasion associated locus B family protein [Alphaproteobacteria bacterium]
MRPFLIAAVATLALFPAAAFAQGQKPAAQKPAAAAQKPAEKAPEKKDAHIGHYGDWDVFEGAEGKNKVCYMATIAKETKGGGTRKDKSYVMVMHRPAAKNLGVVSVTSGYAFKDKSEPVAEIGGEKLSLYTSAKTPDTAWAFEDAKVVQAMLKGQTMVVKGTPAKGDAATDTYSLNGVSKAYQEMNKACGVKS